MARKGKVFFRDKFSGMIIENDNGYAFYYDENYLNDDEAKAISLTMPLRKEPYESSTMIRSEEHTSELQSLRHLVCRLLLEKKHTMLSRSVALGASELHDRSVPPTSAL